MKLDREIEELLNEIYDDLQDVHTNLQHLEGKDNSEREFIGVSWVIVDSIIGDIREFLCERNRFIGVDRRISTND